MKMPFSGIIISIELVHQCVDIQINIFKALNQHIFVENDKSSLYHWPTTLS